MNDKSPAVSEDDGLSWKAKAIIAVVAIAAVVVAYIVWKQVVPRWWSHRVGHAAKGTLTWGIIWGLFTGLLFTAAPLAVGLLGFHKGWTWKTRLWLLLGALVLTAPNLMTAGIVWGSSKAAHDAERTLAVDAPGFRGATLVGVIIGVLVAIAVEVGRMVRRKNASELAALRADQKIRDADL